MGEPEIDDLIFPTMGRDLPSLLQVVLGALLPRQIGGVFLASSTLGRSLSISGSALLEGEKLRSYFLRTFCLSCKLFPSSKHVLCGPSDVHGSL